MKKFLVVNFPGHGHFNPTIKMVKDLVQLGHKVVYYCTEEFRTKIEKSGAEFKSYNYTSIKEEERGNKHILLENTITLSDAILNAVLKETITYDTLIYDSVLSVGEDIAKKLKIKKTVALYTTFAFSKEMLNIGKKSNRRSIMFSADSDEFISKTKKINEKHDIKLRPLIDAMTDTRAEKKIVFTSKYYQPLAETFDDSYSFVGPSIIEREENIKFEIENNANKILVYISLGTIDNKNISFYKTTFNTFKNFKNINVILSVGKELNIESLGAIPSNFKVYNYVPQLEVLKNADIFITHGGMNSSSEGLYNNIPLIIVPQFGDQPLVGKIVSSLGAGIMIPKSDLTEVLLKDAVEKIISNENYKEKATIIGESLREAAAKSADVYKNL